MSRSVIGNSGVDGDHLGHEVAVGEHHALGLAGGAGGVDEAREVVAGARGAGSERCFLAAAAGRRGRDAVGAARGRCRSPARRAGRPPPRAADPRALLARDDQQLGARVGDDVAHLARPAASRRAAPGRRRGGGTRSRRQCHSGRFSANSATRSPVRRLRRATGARALARVACSNSRTVSVRHPLPTLMRCSSLRAGKVAPLARRGLEGSPCPWLPRAPAGDCTAPHSPAQLAEFYRHNTSVYRDVRTRPRVSLPGRRLRRLAACSRNARTVQGELRGALSTPLPASTVRATAPGAPTPGVHAAGQVAHVDLPGRIPPPASAPRSTACSRDDVRVLAVRRVPRTASTPGLAPPASATATASRWGAPLPPVGGAAPLAAAAPPDVGGHARDGLRAARGTHDFAAFALAGHSGHGRRGTRTHRAPWPSFAATAAAPTWCSRATASCAAWCAGSSALWSRWRAAPRTVAGSRLVIASRRRHPPHRAGPRPHPGEGPLPPGP